MSDLEFYGLGPIPPLAPRPSTMAGRGIRNVALPMAVFERLERMRWNVSVVEAGKPHAISMGQVIAMLMLAVEGTDALRGKERWAEVFKLLPKRGRKRGTKVLGPDKSADST